jgi:hypothetical protein
VEVVYRGRAALVAMDDEGVYLIRKSTAAAAAKERTQELIAVPKAGGEPTVLVPRGSFLPSFEVHDGKLFFIHPGEGVASVPLSGGEPTTLAPDPWGVRLTRTGERLLWTSGSHKQPKGETGAIYAVPAGGGERTRIASAGRPATILGDASRVFWMAMPCLYAKVAEGEVQELGCDFGLEMAQDDEALYVVERERRAEPMSTVLRLDKTTHARRPLYRVPAYVQALQVDDGWLYISASNGAPAIGEVVAIPVKGGAPRVLAKDLEDPFRVFVDATHVYVETQADAQRVVRLKRAR